MTGVSGWVSYVDFPSPLSQEDIEGTGELTALEVPTAIRSLGYQVGVAAAWWATAAGPATTGVHHVTGAGQRNKM